MSGLHALRMLLSNVAGVISVFCDKSHGYIDWVKWAMVATLLVPGATLGSNADTASSVVWNLDNLSLIGGCAVTVVGNPAVKDFEFGKGMEFDGIDDGLIVHGCPLDRSSSFTMEILFKPYASFPSNVEQRFFHIQNPGLGSRRMLIELRLNAHSGWFIDTHIRADSSLLTCPPVHLKMLSSQTLRGFPIRLLIFMK